MSPPFVGRLRGSAFGPVVLATRHPRRPRCSPRLRCTRGRCPPARPTAHRPTTTTSTAQLPSSTPLSASATPSSAATAASSAMSTRLSAPRAPTRVSPILLIKYLFNAFIFAAADDQGSPRSRRLTFEFRNFNLYPDPRDGQRSPGFLDKVRRHVSLRRHFRR